MADPQKSPVALRLAVISSLALIGILSMLALLASPKTKPPYIEDTAYSTNVGEVRKLDLRDNTQVRLGTNSSVAIHYSSTERRIELLRGEAVFVPGHDDARTISISALSYRVTDKGTKFSVRINDDSTVTVLVTEGEVLLEPVLAQITTSSGVTLRAGDEGLANGTQIIVHHHSLGELNRRLAWTEGHLYFSDQTLETIVHEVNRYNRLRIVIRDPDVSKVRVSIGFSSTDPISFANALERMGIVTYRNDLQSGDIELVGRKPNAK